MDAKSTQSSGFYDFLAWLDANWKKVVIGAVGVVVVVAAIAFFKWKERQSEIDANRALFSLTGLSAMGTNGVSPDELAKIAQQHPNTSAGERAQLLAAGAAFDQGDYAKAQSHFDAVLKGSPAAGFKAQATFGVAASLEAQKNFDQAIQKYEEVARQYPKENVAPQAKLAIGRIYEAQGKPEEALKLYSEVQNKQDQFEYWQGEAAERKDRLVSRHPELKEQANAGFTDQIIEVTTPPAPDATNP
ncbi:MAG: tetratricopeptide repeat protein [Verrucomicrobia bacterium]|nr:tetratricopeptide repeat protein [Verrucomicrobiota bacterium]